MAISKSAVAILASGSSAAGSTRASPGRTGSAIDVRAYYGGEITFRILNGGSAPGVGLTLVIQASHDGTTWYDYYSTAGDTTASSDTSGAIILDRGVMYVRAISYGNTTNAVTVDVQLQAVTGV